MFFYNSLSFYIMILFSYSVFIAFYFMLSFICLITVIIYDDEYYDVFVHFIFSVLYSYIYLFVHCYFIIFVFDLYVHNIYGWMDGWMDGRRAGRQGGREGGREQVPCCAVLCRVCNR